MKPNMKLLHVVDKFVLSAKTKFLLDFFFHLHFYFSQSRSIGIFS